MASAIREKAAAPVERGPLGTAVADAWTLVRGTGQVLASVGIPLLAIALGAFAIHHVLVVDAGRLALRNGPLGLGLLIVAIALRLALLGWAIWLAGNALRINGVPLTQLARDGSREPVVDDLADVGTSVRLAIAPMIVLYAAWSMVNWDLHSFLQTKYFETGVDGQDDLSNINFTEGGWETYIPWTIGLYLLKVAFEAAERRWPRRPFEIGIVLLEVGWIVAGWLVVGHGWNQFVTWLGDTRVVYALRGLIDSLAWIDLPGGWTLPQALAEAWDALVWLATLTALQLAWPLLWVALVGVIVGWVRPDARPAKRTWEVATRGLREKFVPLFDTAVLVLKAGAIPVLLIAIGYALVLLLGSWLRTGLLLVVPPDHLDYTRLVDLYLRLAEALLTPIRVAFLVAALGLVVQRVIAARRPADRVAAPR